MAWRVLQAAAQGRIPGAPGQLFRSLAAPRARAQKRLKLPVFQHSAASWPLQRRLRALNEVQPKAQPNRQAGNAGLRLVRAGPNRDFLVGASLRGSIVVAIGFWVARYFPGASARAQRIANGPVGGLKL